MNPDTNRFEKLTEPLPNTEHGNVVHEALKKLSDSIDLLRPNGQPVPKHWTVFTLGEQVVIKNYTFKVCYIGETSILFEPVGIPQLNDLAEIKKI